VVFVELERRILKILLVKLLSNVAEALHRLGVNPYTARRIHGAPDMRGEGPSNFRQAITLAQHDRGRAFLLPCGGDRNVAVGIGGVAEHVGRFGSGLFGG